MTIILVISILFYYYKHSIFINIYLFDDKTFTIKNLHWVSQKSPELHGGTSLWISLVLQISSPDESGQVVQVLFYCPKSI